MAGYFPFPGGKSRCVGEKVIETDSLSMKVCVSGHYPLERKAFPVTIQLRGSVSDHHCLSFLSLLLKTYTSSQVGSEQKLNCSSLCLLLSEQGLCEIEIAEALSLELGYRAGLVC